MTRFAPGDEVYGVAPGSFAQYAVADVDKLATKPARAVVRRGRGHTHLGRHRTPGGARRRNCDERTVGTDHRGVRRRRELRRAARRCCGAEVTGVCSLTKRDHVTALGAQQVLDYTRDDWADGFERYDVILDIAGNPSLRRLRRALTPHGTAVFVGGEQSGSMTGMGRQFRGAMLSPFIGATLKILLARERGADYEQLAQFWRRVGYGRCSTAPTRSSRRQRRCGSSRKARSAARSPSRFDEPRTKHLRSDTSVRCGARRRSG